MKISFDKWMVERAKLYAEMEQASKDLQRFPKGKMGLVPQEVRESEEFKQAKSRYDIAFHMVRYINAGKPKTWLRKARDLSRGAA